MLPIQGTNGEKKGKMTDFAEGELYGTKDHCHGLKVTQHKCQFWGTRMPS
jgi:hypothetical protein